MSKGNDLALSFPVGKLSQFYGNHDDPTLCDKCGTPHPFDFVGYFLGVIELNKQLVGRWAILTPDPCPACGAIPLFYSSAVGDTFYLDWGNKEVKQHGCDSRN